MSSKPAPSRAFLLPGADFDQRPIPVTRQPLRTWFRVHRAGSPPILFGRFPHHRFSHPDCPYPLLYVGATIQTCLWEVFGDDIFQGKRTISEGKWRGSCVSQITVPEVGVCAVTLERTRDAMSEPGGSSSVGSGGATPPGWLSGHQILQPLHGPALFGLIRPGNTPVASEGQGIGWIA
jgi:hypothetical protein